MPWIVAIEGPPDHQTFVPRVAYFALVPAQLCLGGGVAHLEYRVAR